jgi:hypothetical protein
MSQSRKKRTGKKSAEKVPGSESVDSNRKGRWTRYIIVAIFLAIIGIIVGVNHYISNAPFRTVVIRVDDTSIRMDYFLKRLRLTTIDATELLGVLSREKLIEMVAPQYVGELTDEDFEQEIRRLASGGSGNITESEFNAWYRQQLNETGFTDAEFRDYATINILAMRMQEYLAERVPTVAEQIHVHVIVVQTYDEAMAVRTRWEEGEDFADLAREVSLDEQSKENGGDLGWLPEGVNDLIDWAAWDLNIGEVTQPVSEAGNYFYLFMVSEREAVRTLDEDNLQALQNQALDKWLSYESPLHEISFHGLTKGRGFDSETYNWINWQLSKESGQSQE